MRSKYKLSPKNRLVKICFYCSQLYEGTESEAWIGPANSGMRRLPWLQRLNVWSHGKPEAD